MKIRGTTRGAHAKAPSRRALRAAFAVAGGAAFVVTPLLAPTSALATDTPGLAGTGVVTMVHAVPGLVADVSIDGKQVLSGFTSSRVTDPITLSAGKHTVTLRSDHGGKPGKTVLTTALDISAGTTSTAVVGLTPKGDAKAFVFGELPAAVPDGQAALVVRDVSTAGPVKVLVNDIALPSGPLANGSGAATDIAAGAHQMLVQSPSGSTILGAQLATLQAGRVTTLYLTGSQHDKTLAWVATTRLASSVTSLSGIPTGDGSTAQVPMTTRSEIPTGTAAAIAGAMGLGAFALSLRRARGRVNA